MDNAPYSESTLSEVTFKNHLKYPIVELPDTKSYLERGFLDFDLDSDSDSTVKEELLSPTERKGRVIVRKVSQADFMVNNKIEDAKSRLSFWGVYNYCSNLWW